MEDRHLISSPIPASEPPVHLLAVFDGHRGAATAAHAASTLQSSLQRSWGAASGEAALKACSCTFYLNLCTPLCT